MKSIKICTMIFTVCMLFVSKPVHAGSGIFINGIEVPEDIVKAATADSPSGQLYQYLGTFGELYEPPVVPPAAAAQTKRAPAAVKAITSPRDEVVITQYGPKGTLDPRTGKFVPLPHQRGGM
jgi:hypothetical protein